MAPLRSVMGVLSLLLLASALTVHASTIKTRDDLPASNGEFLGTHDGKVTPSATITPRPKDPKPVAEPIPESEPVPPVTTPEPKTSTITPDVQNNPPAAQDVFTQDPTGAISAISTGQKTSPAFDPNDPLGGDYPLAGDDAKTGLQTTRATNSNGYSNTVRPTDVTSGLTDTSPAATDVKTPAAACDPSDLDGYTSSYQITKYGHVLHWALVSPTVVKIAFEAKRGSGAAAGWVSVGFSKDGKMSPADVVIGNQPDVPVAAYTMDGYDASSIKLDKAIWIGDASIVTKTNGSLILKFQRKSTDGVAPFSTTKPATVIWAFSADNTQPLAYHGDKRRGSFEVDFSCNGGGGNVATQPTTPVPVPVQNAQVAVGTSCPASTLGQYSFQADLYDGKILLHWAVAPGPLFKMALEAKRLSGAENGWLSVGWSNNGAMAPADAVVGNLPGIKAYRMDGYKLAELVNGTFSLGPNPTVTSNPTGSTVIKFSRTNGDGGSVPINVNGETYVIWAFSRGMLQGFGYHEYNRGLAMVDFLCNKAPVAVMRPGENVANIPGANVNQDDYAGLTPAEREDEEARRERRTARRAQRGAVFRSWANAAFGLPEPTPSSTPSTSP